jgi:O-antigen/teichoic acid export membrane protein
VASVVVGLLGATSGVALVLTRTSVQLVALPMALVVVVVLRSRAAGWVRPRFADLRTVAGRYRDFPIFTTWAALLDMVGRQAPQLILAALFNASVVGLYAMAARLIALPASFLSTSVAAVFFQHAAAARAARQDERFRRDVLTVVCRLNTVGLPLVAAAALLGPPVVTVVFGQRWREAGQYVALLAPVVFAMFVTSPVTILFSVLELHRANIVTQGGMLTVRCIALWLGARFIGTPRGALALYALLVPLAAGVQQAWLLGAAGVSRRTYFGHLARHLLYLAPCLLGWLAMTFWTPLPDLLVAAIALVLGTSYVALAVHEDPAVLDLGHRALQRLGWRRAAQPPPPENELRPR